MTALFRRHLRVCATALATVIAACSGDRTTGTSAIPIDAARTTGDVAAFRTVLDHPAWRSFAALSGQFGLGATTGVISGSAALVDAAALASRGDARDVGASITRSIAERATAIPPTVPAIWPEKLGTTYVYDPAQHRYVADPARAGAPASGVRFILYDVDPQTGEPLTAQEVGYADLVDEGLARPSGIGLHLTVVAGGIAFVDYRVVADGDADHGTLGVDGLVTDGTTRVTIQVAASAHRTSGGSEGSVNFRIAIPDRDFTVTAEAHGTSSGESHAGTLDLAIHSGETTIGVSMKESDHVVDGSFTVNGHLFATVHGSGENVDIRGAGGHELTADERQMLFGIVQLTGSIGEMFAALLGPVALAFMLVGMTG